MIIPIINSNGTSREEHIKLRVEAVRALNVAIECMFRLTPNVRDYPDEEARCEHHTEMNNERISIMQTFTMEILHEMLAIKMEV
jgi:hypothetical protein